MIVAGFKYQNSVFPPDWSVFIKTNLRESLGITFMEKAFPNMKLMHCYRNAFGVSKSWYEVIAESTTDSGLDEAFTRASAHPHSTEFIHEYAVQTTTYSWLNALDLIPPDRPQDQFEWCIIT